MKRYIYLFAVTFAVISAVFMSGYLIEKNIADVYVFEIYQRSADNTISVQGKVQYMSNKGVNSGCNCIISEVFVNDGDFVYKGDALFSYFEIDGNMANIQIPSVSLQEISAFIDNNTTIIDRIKDYSNLKVMYARSNGIISEINFSSGEYVGGGEEILKITDKSSLEIPVNINETVISDIKIDQRVNVIFPALGDKVFSASVTDIASEAKQTAGLSGKETTVETIISLDEEIDDLRIGYSANCSIITSTDKDILIVPYECVRSDNNKEYVYIVLNGKAVKRYIETGKEYKDGVMVKSGVENGDKLIKNCDFISDGQNINIVDEEKSYE